MKKLLLASTMLAWSGMAMAADLVVPMPVKAPVAATVTCTQLSCTGFDAGGVVYGIGGNAAILTNGIQNSIFAGGGDIGLNAGWQYWDGKYYVGFDADGMVQSQNTAGVTGFAGNSGTAVGILHAKFGGNLIGLFSNGPAPITVPSLLATSIMASYIDTCSAFRKGGTQFCSGAGTQFLLTNRLTLDIIYDYGAPTNNFNALQNVGVKVAYHF